VILRPPTKQGQGFYQLMEQLPQERLITAVIAQASIEAAVAMTIRYTKQRKELIARSL
jgi:acyl-CoA dehydrogenase